MQNFSWNTIRILFKLTCLIITILSIVYWSYIYAVADEDLCLVDYKKIEAMQHNELPVLSMCFANPFLDTKLKEINPGINGSLYLNYLKGETFDEKLHNVNYSDVTFHLPDYILSSTIVRRNGTVESFNKMISHKIEVTFSGVYLVNFIKCYGITLKKDYYKDVKIFQITFKRSSFLDPSMRSSHMFSIFLHYPNQFLLSNYPKWFVTNSVWNYGFIHEVLITGVEMLHRRNKRKEKCLDNTMDYDGSVLQKHIKQNKCRAPYLMEHLERPICTHKTQIKASMYEVFDLNRKYTPPCRGMTKVDFESVEHHTDLYRNDTTILNIVYPDRIKIILQSKSVDFQTFTSNVGGVIGIYVGNTADGCFVILY